MDESALKFRVIRNVIFVLAAIVILWSIKLQLFEGQKYFRLSEENRIRKKYIEASRGKILDRHGTEIANTRPGFYVSVVRATIDTNTLHSLARILDMKVNTIIEKSRIMLNKKTGWKNPYGDGHAGRRMVDVLVGAGLGKLDNKKN